MSELRRRHALDDNATRGSSPNDVAEKRRKPPAELNFTRVFLFLSFSRIVSAFLNPVHDCDEVFNYWEPLHFLMYGSGMQTWEYSAEYALRSYLYPLLHAPVGAATALIAGDQAGKRLVFYAVKAFLGIFSAYVEANLHRSLVRSTGQFCGSLFLFFLTVSTGLFVSATSLLPSSFAMYMLTGASSGVLDKNPTKVIVFAVICVVWGWPVAGVSLLPYAVWVLFQGRLLRSVGVLLASLVATLLPVIAADRFFYGNWTISLWNFLKYNVVGGGDSALYGVESATYYLRNGLINLNILLPLGLLAPLLAFVPTGRKSGSGVRGTLACAVTPVWVWMTAITLLPHKEERFLYVAYPIICMGAAVSLHAVFYWIHRALMACFGRSKGKKATQILKSLALIAFALLSLSRSTALVKHYGAPMNIYSHLPKVSKDTREEIPVCVGAEWHRFPSSFFLPHPNYRLRFVKSGFTGLLPRPFNLAEGGTAAGGPYFNDRNKEEPDNYWPDDSQCTYLVELERRSSSKKGRSGWNLVKSYPFVIAEGSKSLLARVLFIPWFSSRRNEIADYCLYERSSLGKGDLLDALSASRSSLGRPF